MAITGTVPRFDLSIQADPSSTVVTVTGAATGQPTGSYSNEPLNTFFKRVIDALSVSGVLAVSGGSSGAVLISGLQCIPPSVVSGMRNMQRELAFRVADVELGGSVSNAARLAHAQAVLTNATSGEVQLGT